MTTGANIVQFGTSRFLQAHADLMISEAMAPGAEGPITVVETTGSPASRGRIAAFASGEPFEVHIRGLSGGRRVDETRLVRSVSRGLSARKEAGALRAAFREATHILSNTGDRGYDIPESPTPTLDGWTSFPELLTALLHDRFTAGLPGVTLMPCELVPENGAVLLRVVRRLALSAHSGRAFDDWLTGECVWANSLVDRIVSEPVEPVGAVAEPYALWVVETQPRLVPPCEHPDLRLVESLEPYATRKLYLLNLPHTLLAQRWLDGGGGPEETVRGVIAEPETRAWLREVMETDVVPAFTPEEATARAYWEACLERFDNPFLDHRLADIAQNHSAKIERRAAGLARWARGRRPTARFPKLAAAFPELAEVA